MTWVWASSPYSGERLLVHLAMADFANDEGICFPSHATLARKARCSTAWVSKSLRQMIRDGLLEEIEKAGSGRGKVGRYRLLQGGTPFNLSDELGGTRSSVRSNSEQSDTYSLNRQEPSETETDFKRLWDAYPRKTAKAVARRAFARLAARKDAPTIEVLLAAVARYAEQFADGRTERKYCAHLGTWLNGERWSDEIESAPRVTAEKSGEIRSAESLAAAFVHTGRDEDALLASLASYSAAARDAALAVFRELKGTTI